MLCQNVKSNYVAELDFWKFVFSIMIVFGHGTFLANTEAGDRLVFGGAVMGVEFYFLLTGFFLVNSIYRSDVSTLTFIKRRVLNLLPYFIYAFLFCAAVWFADQIFFQHLGRWQLFAKSLNGIWDFLWLGSSGVATSGINGTWWFLSTMLFVEWTMYPLIKHKERLFVSYIGPLAFFLLLGFISGTFGRLSAREMIGFIKSDNLRGFLDIIAGALLFYVVYVVQKVSLRRWVKVVLTVVSWIGFLSIWVISYKNNVTISDYVDLNLQFISIPIMSVSIGIILSGNSLTGKLFNPKICKVLGRFSTCLYMVHWQCMILIKRLAPADMTYHQKLFLLFPLSFLVAFLVMKLAEFSVAFIHTHKKDLKRAFCVSVQYSETR